MSKISVTLIYIRRAFWIVFIIGVIGRSCEKSDSLVMYEGTQKEKIINSLSDFDEEDFTNLSGEDLNNLKTGKFFNDQDWTMLYTDKPEVFRTYVSCRFTFNDLNRYLEPIINKLELDDVDKNVFCRKVERSIVQYINTKGMTKEQAIESARSIFLLMPNKFGDIECTGSVTISLAIWNGLDKPLLSTCGISNIQPPYARLKWLEEELLKQSLFSDAHRFRGFVYEAYTVFYYQHSDAIDRNASQHGGDLFASMMDEWNLMNGEMKTFEVLIGQSAITWPE